MFKRNLPFTAARKRLAFRLILMLAAALVLVSGAVVGRRLDRNAASRQTPPAPARAAGAVPDVFAAGLS